MPERSATVCMSLSPRPDRLTSMLRPGPIAAAARRLLDLARQADVEGWRDRMFLQLGARYDDFRALDRLYDLSEGRHLIGLEYLFDLRNQDMCELVLRRSQGVLRFQNLLFEFRHRLRAGAAGGRTPREPTFRPTSDARRPRTPGRNAGPAHGDRPSLVCPPRSI